MKSIFLYFTFFNLFSSPLTLLSLTDVSRISVDNLKKDQSLIVTFQANCVSCKKQIRDLNCLQKTYKVHLVGVTSSEKALRQEYRKMKTSYPAFYGDTNALKQLKINGSITPQIVFWNKGSVITYYGYKKCEEYRSLLRGKENG